MRTVSRTNDKFERLHNLRCYDDVHEMLTTGWPLSEVAKYIQKTKHESTDIEELTLIYLLQAFRRSLPPTTLIAKPLPHAFTKAVQRIEDGLDVMAEMTKLYQIQMKRIEIDHKLEEKAQKLIPSLNQEVREARSILESIQKMKHDLGLDPRHLGTLQIEAGGSDEVVTRYGKPSVRRVLEDPQASRKVLSLAERFVQISQARSEIAGDSEEDEAGLMLDEDEPDADDSPEFDLAADPEDSDDQAE